MLYLFFAINVQIVKTQNFQNYMTKMYLVIFGNGKEFSESTYGWSTMAILCASGFDFNLLHKLPLLGLVHIKQALTKRPYIICKSFQTFINNTLSTKRLLYIITDQHHVINYNCTFEVVDALYLKFYEMPASLESMFCNNFPFH